MMYLVDAYEHVFYSKTYTIRFDAGFALTCIHGKHPKIMHLK